MRAIGKKKLSFHRNDQLCECWMPPPAGVDEKTPLKMKPTQQKPEPRAVKRGRLNCMACFRCLMASEARFPELFTFTLGDNVL